MTSLNPHDILAGPGIRMTLAAGLMLCALTGATLPGHAASNPAIDRGDARAAMSLPLERPDDPPGVPAESRGIARIASTITFGRFTSVQVNVNGAGANIVGDAANEPSIAVDPTDPSHMAIGWRQFDTVTSNFRQAGFGYTTNGGQSWTTGKINPGVFRSDPVLGADAAGVFFYNSLTSNGFGISSQVFPSSNGGMTWGPSVFAYGGDKQWMTFDRTASVGHDHIYQAWSTAGNNYDPFTFNRSNDDGATFELPTFMASSPVWGTLDVASDGTLYVVGTDGPGGAISVDRSTDARNGGPAPTFSSVTVNLGGAIRTGAMNPAGLLGQLWIAVDRSNGPRAGWIYVLASVQTPTDPLDVEFIRSADGGTTWSTPVRVNTDPEGTRAFQWFGTMSVAPSGRIDVVWNDTRGSADSTRSALYYSSSTNGGLNWTPNEQVSPTWLSTVGFPNQSKIGDYYHMISDDDGADLAWAATFNNEQDVYYTRIPRATVSVADDVPRAVRLHPNSPNPFTSSTAIQFDVPASGARVKLEVFDATGQRVATLADRFTAGGPQVAHWAGKQADGRPATSGIYFCRYQVLGISETRKLMLLR
jgi:hypothetical protein